MTHHWPGQFGKAFVIVFFSERCKRQKGEKTSGDVWATHCLFCACWDSGRHRGAGQDYCILAGQFSKDIRLFHFSSRETKIRKRWKDSFLISPLYSNQSDRTGEGSCVMFIFLCWFDGNLLLCLVSLTCITIAVIQSNFCDPLALGWVKNRVKKQKVGRMAGRE